MIEKEVLKMYLKQKKRNQDIAVEYGISFQKVIQLIKKNDLNANELRKTNLYIVYEHWKEKELVYVGSGLWYRARRYSNRRNAVHRNLMKEGKIFYNIVGEYKTKEEARTVEMKLIQKYKLTGQAEFNKHVR